jgi:hypothetical protein
VKQRLALHVENRRILGRVCDFENPLAPVFGAQTEVLVPLTTQWMDGRLDAEGPLGDVHGLLGRKRRGLRLQDAFGSGLGLGGGGHGFNLRCG